MASVSERETLAGEWRPASGIEQVHADEAHWRSVEVVAGGCDWRHAGVVVRSEPTAGNPGVVAVRPPTA